MEKVSTPVDRHCDRKRTDKRNPAETENLASRPSHRRKDFLAVCLVDGRLV
jgi:hypothetical protein